ncbi:MAG: CvpA family protein [Azoarcus sp.]|jgi:membrane protein required for colicin V production|nr:CvpA family protein [Azoarcus sp.]
MTVFDYMFLSILGLSIALGLWRGLVSEVLGLAALVLAVIVAGRYADVAALQFESMIDDPRGRMAAAFALILFAVLLVVSLVKLFLRRLLRAVGLGATDRFFGAVFGAFRGLVITLILVWVGGLIGMSHEPWWKQALSAPLLEKAVGVVGSWLPDVDVDSIADSVTDSIRIK